MSTASFWRSSSLFVLLLALPAALCAGEKPNFSGKWQMDAAAAADKPGAPVKRIVEQTGLNIHINDELRGSDTKEFTLDIRCTINGQQCDVKSPGHEGQVSFYFMGDMLVEIDSSLIAPDTVIKRHMKLAADGKSITIELVSIVPPGKPNQTVTLKKQEETKLTQAQR